MATHTHHATGPAGSRLAPAPEWTGFPAGDFTVGYSVHGEVVQYAAFKRNLLVTQVSSYFFSASDGSRTVSFWGHTPETTSLVARRVSNSKHLTKMVLQSAGLNVPEGMAYAADDEAVALNFAKRLGPPVVVKPVSGSGGVGVSAHVETEGEFAVAWERARKAGGNMKIIVERHISGKDYRLFVIGDQLRAAALRIPAHVVGDGKSSIGRLITQKNVTRKANPYSGAKGVKLTAAVVANLEKLGLTGESVVPDGRRVTLQTVANIGAGGEGVDVTERVHPEFAEIAVRACRTLPGAIHCGVDLLAEDIETSAAGQRWAICEVNTCPDIALHHFPTHGTARDVAGDLIEHLFPDAKPLDRQGWRTVRATLKGRFNAAKSRPEVERMAMLRGLTGWIETASSSKLEVVLCGPPAAIENILERFRSPRPWGAVDDLSSAPWGGLPPDRFIAKP